MYSRYEGRGNGSSVYMVKTGVRRVLANYPDCYDYSSGITGDDTSDHITYEPAAEALAEMKLTPYKGLSSETIIRYLYTGREYNIETGDYYYRYRMMEAGIGRFTSKDPIKYFNRYTYVDNKPLKYVDKYGLFPWLEVLGWAIGTGTGTGITGGDPVAGAVSGAVGATVGIAVTSMAGPVIGGIVGGAAGSMTYAALTSGESTAHPQDYYYSLPAEVRHVK